MRVDQAFSRAGFEIVEAKRESSEVLTCLVRVPLGPIVPQRWKVMMEHVLPIAEEVAAKEVVKWRIDLSKMYFAKNGNIRYFWRVRMSGDLASCQAALVQATLNALRTGNELNAVPLVGNTGLEPKPGSFKGAYPRGEDDRASQLVAAAFSVGAG